MINFLKLSVDDAILWKVTLGKPESTVPGNEVLILAKNALIAGTAALAYDRDPMGPQNEDDILAIECIGGAIINAM